MLSLGKTIVISVIAFGLVFFSGNFCSGRFCAQAFTFGTSDNQQMVGVAMDTTVAPLSPVSDVAVPGSETKTVFSALSHTSLNPCITECGSRLPQVVIAKKFSSDFAISSLASSFSNQEFASVELSLGPTDLTGTQLLTPDILFSVVKKE